MSGNTERNEAAVPTRRPLFRVQAMASAQKTHGVALWDPIPPGGPLRRFAYLIALGVIAYLPFHPFPKFIEVRGYSRPTASPQVLVTRQGGVVTAVLAQQGQDVDAGAVLAEVSRDASAKNLVSLQQFERERLLEKRLVLLAARRSEQETLASQAEGLRTFEEKTRAIARLNKDATTTAAARERLLEREILRTKDLRIAGFISEAAERNRTAEHLEAVRAERLSEAQAAIRDIDDFKDYKALRQLMIETRRLIQGIDAQLIDLESQLERLHQAPMEQIVATRGGKLIQMIGRPGEVLREGDVVAIVGVDARESRVELYVPAHLADTMVKGQSVLLSDSQQDLATASQRDRRPTPATITAVVSVPLDGATLRMPVVSEGRFVLAYASPEIPVPSGRTFKSRIRVGEASLFDLVFRFYKSSASIA